MIKGRTVKIVYALALSLFAAPAFIIYQGTRPAIVFPAKPVEYVQQCYGTAVSITLDLSAYTALEQPLFSTSVSDLKGHVVIATDPTWLQVGQRYSLITYRDLPIGVFNVNVQTAYKLNQFAIRSHRYTMAVLNVVEGEKYACY